uniref:RNA-free ribonuclease P n=1 Tax=Halorhodospira halophila (strain DSM 244 / SL1) TaxID=349124 RepID=UPI001C31EAF5|nr:Chain A, RNA-free ribonuclease P [Halorhodospira halophila SL1]7OG5_B Chain B, RNA-free ribonuclease P [Halorhodospira halophila SL1]7OG5_C Chain C, RNA-free ribonuclease P [Halorhodospira halophila SL1]7OG5_D Chain D, RNA-free ribonuclease P [Halorhodospira halophila SL1]7OG5_E Chain E, RNA-free ribonuclease P [Halorhodospira halophila SL1]7OG5_F Chain F, RNA-free ribonuclease P [Halorhodospira halophila SL1]7OG5_G Chain G, RNA-free ribonuclease P [Halorhodospira halophila SL1]7OG5_H Cha
GSHMASRRFVLDTSVFTNPDVYLRFDEEPMQAISVFLGLARRADAEFYMPGPVYQELCNLRSMDLIGAEFETEVYIRSPRRFSMTIPSEVLYEFIEEVRTRIQRGLRIAEEHARQAGQAESLPPELITQLRERYREAMRRGILDSREDIDVVLLAYELDATLVSADEGMRKFAERIGIKLVNPRYLRGVMQNLAGDDPGHAPPCGPDQPAG